MPHDLVFDRIVPDFDQVAFVCTQCGAEIWFSKPGDGEPHATELGGIWSPPDNPDQWMTPCTGTA